MKFPDKFPEGCEFFASFSGDEFVRFPDGGIFKASDDGASLVAVKSLPARGAPMTESAFVACAAKSRAFAAKAAS